MFGRIAQLVEQLTLNQRVPGSSPGAPTNQINDLGGFIFPEMTNFYVQGNSWGNTAFLLLFIGRLDQSAHRHAERKDLGSAPS